MVEEFNFGAANPPASLDEIKADLRRVRKAFREAGIEKKLLTSISTRANRSGRRQTGEHQTNRQSRWTLATDNPQYGTEVDCKLIELRLIGSLLAFSNPPAVDADTVTLIAERYLGAEPVSSTYRDSLLLEAFDFEAVVAEATNPTHGMSKIHLGHEDPTIQPKHVPDNIAWRTQRSNLIQGDMTLREARIYIIKLIARYFELGELEISD